MVQLEVVQDIKQVPLILLGLRKQFMMQLYLIGITLK